MSVHPDFSMMMAVSTGTRRFVYSGGAQTAAATLAREMAVESTACNGVEIRRMATGAR